MTKNILSTQKKFLSLQCLKCFHFGPFNFIIILVSVEKNQSINKNLVKPSSKLKATGRAFRWAEKVKARLPPAVPARSPWVCLGDVHGTTGPAVPSCISYALSDGILQLGMDLLWVLSGCRAAEQHPWQRGN